MVGCEVLSCSKQDSPFWIELTDDKDEDDKGGRFAGARGS